VVEGAGSAPAIVLTPFPAELPGTALEAEVVSRSRSGTRVLPGRRATEGALRTALASGRIVHVASHGTLNPRSPMFSRLDLYPSTRSRPDDDGRLEVHELLDLVVHSPLVFLSGCETGAGVSGVTAFDRGEDYATLARTLLFAGADNVIATLWRVRDDGAAEFARLFYERLAGAETRGERGDTASVLQALADAQRALRRQERFRSAFYWAGFVLSGTGRIDGKSGEQGDSRKNASGVRSSNGAGRTLTAR
jgi:CHAT domain-containing protein